MATVKLTEFKTYTWTARSGIGANSLDTSSNQIFVTKTNEFAVAATAGSVVAWVSLTQKAFASDNQTVAKAILEFIPNDVDNLYEVAITWGSVTVSSEYSYFNLTDSVTVNGATASATTGQVQLVKYISATAGKFKIANKNI